MSGLEGRFMPPGISSIVSSTVAGVLNKNKLSCITHMLCTCLKNASHDLLDPNITKYSDEAPL
jgi:hypothetical protein